MSLIFRTYGCSSCDREWEELMDRSDQHPSFCKFCGSKFDGDVEPVPGTHAIGGSAIVKAVDGTYRWAEESSIARAEEHNAPHMKITNMRDHLREGDIAAMPLPRNVVTDVIDEQSRLFGARYGFQGPAASSGEARPPIGQGYVGPGHVALSAVQGDGGRTHLSQRAIAIEAGRVNKVEK